MQKPEKIKSNNLLNKNRISMREIGWVFPFDYRLNGNCHQLIVRRFGSLPISFVGQSECLKHSRSHTRHEERNSNHNRMSVPFQTIKRSQLTDFRRRILYNSFRLCQAFSVECSQPHIDAIVANLKSKRYLRLFWRVRVTSSEKNAVDLVGMKL